MSGKILFTALSSAMLLFACGCRNHLEYIENTTQRFEREGQEQSYSVTPAEESPTGSSITLKALREIRGGVEIIEVKTVTERFTPYQGWREIYEIPTGIVLFPVAFVTHVFSICTFGMFPFQWAVGLTNFSFACMNPALNAEMEGRAQTEVVETVEKRLGVTNENKSVPAAGLLLTLRSGGRNWEIRTDTNGEAEFSFLPLEGKGGQFDPTGREVTVYAEGSSDAKTKFIISRDLLKRLSQGEQILRDYRSSPTGGRLASSIEGLEKLNFVKLALQLEKNELEANRSDTAFLDAFRSASK